MKHEYTIPGKNGFTDLYVVTREGVLDRLNLSGEERVIYRDIIDSIEDEASVGVKNRQIAQIPFIGCVRINIAADEFFSEMDSMYENWWELSGSNFYRHKRDAQWNAVIKRTFLDNEKTNLRFLRGTGRQKYDELVKEKGVAWAEMYLYAIYLLGGYDVNDKKRDSNVYWTIM